MRTVVLVGGGHAHVQVLRRWAMTRPKDLRLLLVVDRPVAIYSGMVPGFVAGDYDHSELEIDVVPLARRAGAGVILEAAVDIDPVRHEITIEGRPPLRYDLASIDVGSTVRGLDLPGVREHALSTRPIGHFVREVDLRIEALARPGARARILIVGSGAAGSELAFTLDARLRDRGIDPQVCVVTPDRGLLADASAKTRACIQAEAVHRGIQVRTERRVLRVDTGGAFVRAVGDTAHFTDEEYLEADLVVWATGAAPIAFPSGQSVSSLTRDKHGFLEVRNTLQVIGHEDVFAVGDCARLVDHRWVPRAGVYAVRQGPVLEANLRARLEGRPLRVYRPQRDFLSLLHLGQSRALASKWGQALVGSKVLRLKDLIDRRFMRLFQILDEDGSPRSELAMLGRMGSEEEEAMACGGCAAKLAPLPLEAALAALPAPPADKTVVLGLDDRDDVAATLDRDGGTTLHNVDVIRAFCDDPFLIGRVATSNALSDLYAKGGRPRYAQAIIGLPDFPADEAQEILYQTLSGIRRTLDECRVTLLGGHTTIGADLTVGLAVTGDGPSEETLLRQSGAQAGDVLLLTQPLGTGIVLAADMQGLARGEWVQTAHRVMQRTHQAAGRIACELPAHAATDVTGFGIAGHLMTMLEGSRLVARIERGSVPFLPGAQVLWEQGLRSTAHPANRAAFAAHVRTQTDDDEAWLFDPQTAGGLLIAVAPAQLTSIQRAFHQAGEPKIHRIGVLVRISEALLEKERIEIIGEPRLETKA